MKQKLVYDFLSSFLSFKNAYSLGPIFNPTLSAKRISNLGFQHFLVDGWTTMPYKFFDTLSRCWWFRVVVVVVVSCKHVKTMTITKKQWRK
jgi:hypothetical protein